MLFLVLFQFGPLQVDDLYLAVQVLLDDIVVLGLFVQVLQLLIDTLLFLLDPGLVSLTLLFFSSTSLSCSAFSCTNFSLASSSFSFFRFSAVVWASLMIFLAAAVRFFNLFCRVFCEKELAGDNSQPPSNDSNYNSLH
jgi:hypothetical protein